MATHTEGNKRTFIATTALEPFRLVTVDSSGQVGYTGLAGAFDGSTDDRANTALDPVSVRLRSASGTHKLTASKSIAAGALVYPVANGKITDASNATVVGRALEAASGDGSVIEVLVFNTNAV